MSSEENKRFYQQFLEAQNQFSLENIDRFFDQYYTPDFVQHNFGPQGIELDLPAMRQAILPWLRDYQEIKYVVDDILAEGDRVATRGSVTARKTATGELERWTYFCIARITLKKVAEEWQLVVQVPVETKAAR